MTPDDSIFGYLHQVQQRTRASRHARSLPLLVVAVAVAVLAVMTGRGYGGYEAVAVPVAAFLTLALLTRAQRARSGVGTGRDGTWLAFGLSLVPVVALPVPVMLGAGFALGVGLVALGARSTDPVLWGPGVALMALSPFVRFAMVGPVPSAVVLGLCSAGLLALALRAVGAERLTARTAVA